MWYRRGTSATQNPRNPLCRNGLRVFHCISPWKLYNKKGKPERRTAGRGWPGRAAPQAAAPQAAAPQGIRAAGSRAPSPGGGPARRRPGVPKIRAQKIFAKNLPF